MGIEKSDIYRTFEEHLTTETSGASHLPRKLLPNVIRDQMSHKVGLEVFEQYEKTHGKQSEPLKSDVLLFSLLKKIPKNVDLLTPPQIEVKGVEFKKPMTEEGLKKRERIEMYKRPRVIAPFVDQIREQIEWILVPQQIDINGEMKKSANYFLNRGTNLIRNKKLAGRMREKYNLTLEDANQEQQKIAEETFEGIFEPEDLPLLNQILEPAKQPKPLYEVASGKNLCEEWGADARALLNYIFADEGVRVLDNSEYVLFSSVGIFYIEDDQIKSIQPNYKYLKFFFDNEEAPKIPKAKYHGDAYAVLKVDLKETIKETIKEKLDGLPLSPLEELEKWIEENLGMEMLAFEGGVRAKSELREAKYTAILKKLLENLKHILPHFFSMLNITGDRRGKVDINSKKDVATHFKMHSQEFRLPKGLHKFLYRQGNTKAFPIITIQDLRLLEKYPEYEKIIYLFIFAEIFQHIIEKGVICRGTEENPYSTYREEHDEAYEALKEVIGRDRIIQERNLLQSYGFKKRQPLSEYAVLLNYFAHFGVLYMMEKSEGKVNKALSSNFRNYFRKYVDKVPFGELAEHADENEASLVTDNS